jgi:hypothetical protein
MRERYDATTAKFTLTTKFSPLLSLNLIFVAVAHHEGRDLRWYVNIDLF